MKKLRLTQNSLTPFWMKDLEYMQSSFEEAVKGVIKGLSLEDKNMIISGCKVTDAGGVVSMTSGWCYYEGEILRVEALPETKHASTGPLILLEKAVRCIEEGKRQIASNGTVEMADIYEETYLNPRLLAGDGQVSYFDLAIAQGAWDLGERLVRQSKMTDSGPQQAVIESYIAHDVQYRKIGGVVQLYGYFTNDAVGAPIKGTAASGLPLPVRAVTIGDCTIDKRGQLVINSESDYVPLDGFTYLSQPEYPANDGHYYHKQNDDIA